MCIQLTVDPGAVQSEDLQVLQHRESLCTMLPAAAQQLNCRHRALIASLSTRQTTFHSITLDVRRKERCCQLAAAVSPEQHQQAPSSLPSSSCLQSQQQTACISQNSSWWSRLDWELLLLVSAVPVPPALAEEGLAYDSSKGEGIVKTLSGAFYIGILLYFLFKVLNRRARKAREEVRKSVSPAA